MVISSVGSVPNQKVSSSQQLVSCRIGFSCRRDLLTLQSKVPFSLKVAFLVSDFVKLCIANKVIGFLEMSELELAS